MRKCHVNSGLSWELIFFLINFIREKSENILKWLQLTCSNQADFFERWSPVATLVGGLESCCIFPGPFWLYMSQHNPCPPTYAKK